MNALAFLWPLRRTSSNYEIAEKISTKYFIYMKNNRKLRRRIRTFHYLGNLIKCWHQCTNILVLFKYYLKRLMLPISYLLVLNKLLNMFDTSISINTVAINPEKLEHFKDLKRNQNFGCLLIGLCPNELLLPKK